MRADHWRRHANKWSVWTRLGAVPLFAIVVYYRDLMGWWTWAPVILIGVWMVLNVRVFTPERRDTTWEARAIFGEKFWLERKQTGMELPAHHLRWILRLNIASGLMVLPMAWGLWVFDPWATAFGSVGLVAGQIWALDRYSWLYADVTRRLDEPARQALVEGAGSDP